MSDLPDPGLDPELAELLASLIDESITDEQFARLEERLRGDPRARRLYLDYRQVHDDLRDLAVRMVIDDGWAVAPAPGETAAARRNVRPGRIKASLFGAGLLVLLVLVALSAFLWQSSSRQTRPFATLTRASDCVWDGSAPPQPGDPLAAGPMDLRKGTAEIRLVNGVDLLVEAPARLELVDAGRSSLHAGRIVARVQPAARGFSVDTPRARFVDLGTEFGVSVEPDRETVMEVFDGAVIAELKNPDPSGKKSHRLVAGEGVRIDASDAIELQEVLFSHERFLHTFSTPSVHEGDELIPFKPSGTSSLDVLPAPGRVTIDGDLSDWDLSGELEARCAGSFAESCYVRGAMMYDREFLYIAARVGDPMPMRNVIDPDTDPWSAWMGGSLQLRLSTERTFGWPVKAMKPAYRQGETNPQDTSARLVHLTLWYFQPREQPCLEVRYGMKLDRGAVNPSGWQGAFRKAPDGRVYTVECAIPWAVLGAGDDPPRTGDELGVCWTVNWSDASGKRWKGQLIEVKNPAYAARGKALTFIYAETWGKAIYR